MIPMLSNQALWRSACAKAVMRAKQAAADLALKRAVLTRETLACTRLQCSFRRILATHITAAARLSRQSSAATTIQVGSTAKQPLMLSVHTAK